MNSDYENNLVNCGIRLLKKLKMEFKERKSLQKEKKEVEYMISDIKHMLEDEEFPKDDLLEYNIELKQEICKLENEIKSLNKKISISIDCVNAVNCNMIERHTTFPLKWYRLIRRVQPEIEIFLIDSSCQLKGSNGVNKNNQSEKDFCKN